MGLGQHAPDGPLQEVGSAIGADGDRHEGRATDDLRPGRHRRDRGLASADVSASGAGWSLDSLDSPDSLGLAGAHTAVELRRRLELVGSSEPVDASVDHHEDLLAVGHRREAVGDDDRRDLAGETLSMVEILFSESTSSALVGLVEHEDVGTFDECTRDRETLPLPAGQSPATLAELGVESPGSSSVISSQTLAARQAARWRRRRRRGGTRCCRGWSPTSSPGPDGRARRGRTSSSGVMSASRC